MADIPSLRFTLMKNLLALFVIFSFPACSFAVEAPQWITDPSLETPFTTQNVKGVFVLFDPETNTLITNDEERAQTRYFPASTFKIANSIIGLSTGAVKDIYEVLPYGGKPQFLKQWEQDMNLNDAIKVSNVPVYQELARRIGLERMQDYVKRMEYGNQNIGTVIDRFWLDGPLKISAAEQTLFLHRYLSGSISVTKKTLADVTQITLVEEKDGKTIHAKTGWSIENDPDVGWWVGWVQKKSGSHYPFALNIDFKQDSDAPKRMVIAKACLIELGVWPGDNK